MRTDFSKVLFCGVLSLMASVPAAHAASGISVYGLTTDSKPKYDPNLTTGDTSAKWGFGGGAAVELGKSPFWGVQLGAQYVGRKWTLPGVSDLTNNYLQIPLLLRLHFGLLSIGAGGYYAIAVGDAKGDNGVTVPYSTLGWKKSDYGLTGAVGLNLPVGPMSAVFIEGRYQIGLADQLDPAVPGASVKWSDIQGLVGLRFGMLR